MKNKTKEIRCWVVFFVICCPVWAVTVWQLAKFGVFTEQYIGKPLSCVVVLLSAFVCGYVIKILADKDIV